MVNRQLELGLGNPACRAVAGRRRRSRARWWFEQMRGLVNDAPDWEAAPPEHAPRPTPGQAESDPLESGDVARTTSPGPPTASFGAEPALKAPRWKFARTRRLLWE